MRVIDFREVSKSFRVSTGRKLLRSHLSEWFGRTRRQRFFALRSVSFSVEAGESVAVVGANGAGKSTLLSLLSGLAEPDGGELHVDGQVAGLLDLGAGFHPDLTGAENLRINASLIGLSERRTRELYDRIIEFSGISDFIHEPLRTYSSGMMMRLAFSVAVHIEPDILLLDEIFAVGDQEFQARCFAKVMDFRRAGRTMLCVSHAPATLRRLCERAIWLDHGRLMMDGAINDVLAAYESRLVAAAQK